MPSCGRDDNDIYLPDIIAVAQAHPDHKIGDFSDGTTLAELGIKGEIPGKGHSASQALSFPLLGAGKLSASNSRTGDLLQHRIPRRLVPTSTPPVTSNTECL